MTNVAGSLPAAIVRGMSDRQPWRWTSAPGDTTWRRDWEISRPDGVGVYSARHASGLALELYYDSLDEEDVDQGWMIWTEEDSEPLAAQMDLESPGRLSALRDELMALWRELGFKDDIRSGLKRP